MGCKSASLFYGTRLRHRHPCDGDCVTLYLTDIENGFKIDFRKVWPCLGFSRQDNAKASLLRYFKKGVDYDLLTSQEVSNVFTGVSEDYDQRAEIIMNGNRAQ